MVAVVGARGGGESDRTGRTGTLGAARHRSETDGVVSRLYDESEGDVHGSDRIDCHTTSVCSFLYRCRHTVPRTFRPDPSRPAKDDTDGWGSNVVHSRSPSSLGKGLLSPGTQSSSESVKGKRVPKRFYGRYLEREEGGIEFYR